MGNQEIEISWVICSLRPGHLIKRFAELTNIGHYALGPVNTYLITDFYLDTSQGELGKQRIALRLRRTSRNWFITYKGPSFTIHGNQVRSEFEYPWSPAGLSTILEHVRASLHADMPAIPMEQACRENPLYIMKSMGFTTIQERETTRRARSVFQAESAPYVPLAELALDSVTYRFGDLPVRHHEVELEVKSRKRIPLLKSIRNLLESCFSAELRPWPYGKLVTGFALQTLAEKNELQGLIGPRGDIIPPGYDVLERTVDSLLA